MQFLFVALSHHSRMIQVLQTGIAFAFECCFFCFEKCFDSYCWKLFVSAVSVSCKCLLFVVQIINVFFALWKHV